MREIKFRFWEPVNKHMAKWGEFNYKFVVETPVYGELMQYTGLKDKNGNEIYEGDIVRRRLPEFLFDENHTVVWDELNARFKLGGNAPLLFQCDEDEVIGNVHENPELLNEKQD